MIPVQVHGISQEFNFKTRAQDTFAVFVLPNGYSFRSPITDETAQVLIGMAISGGDGPSAAETARTELPAPPPVAHTNGASFVESVDPEGTPTHVFGGETSAGSNDGFEASSDAAPTVTPVRPKYVGKDEYGYPMIAAAGGVEPTAVTGSLGEGDEDGVRSV